MLKRNFIILIGGPGIYFACDPVHDKAWSNYIVPMQLAASKKLYKIDDEKVHWLVFAPAYRKRWNDDINIDSSEKKEYGLFGRDRYTKDWEWYKSDTWLHQHRQQTAKKVLTKRGPTGKPATSYLNRISQICTQLSFTYKAIEKPDDFWTYLGALQDGSISRVWYCGHAAGKGLFLDLTHNVPPSACTPRSSNYVNTDQIQNYAPSLKPKFDTESNQVSEFYGCYTAKFAQKWNQHFGVATEGAEKKITFQAIYHGNPTQSVLERLKKQPTTSGSPGWKSFAKPQVTDSENE